MTSPSDKVQKCSESGVHPWKRNIILAAASFLVTCQQLAIYNEPDFGDICSPSTNTGGKNMFLHRFVNLFASATLTGVLLLATGAHAQGKWTRAPDIPEGANEVIGANVNGQILVYGGQDSKCRMGIFWRVDPATWQEMKVPANPVA